LSVHSPIVVTMVSSPAEGPVADVPRRTEVDGVEVVGALSPSRAGDFMACPLLYRFRTVDKLPEPYAPVAVRGTVVHKVLEELFDLPAAERTPARAAELVAPSWEALQAAEPAVAEMFGADGPDVDDWLRSCGDALEKYFLLEDPRRLEPAERELYVETVLASGLLLRGYVDRLDVAPSGDIRVVDYKTGHSPGEAFEARALFQMRFYALVIWRNRGILPTALQLVYLGNGEMLRYSPDEDDLLATERKVRALWKAISHATKTGDWRPSPGPLCTWCAHQAICPAFGGTPPPLPSGEVTDRFEDPEEPLR
jgi:putative RecB family exonuclease